MANNIKGITVEIGGETTGLKAALKDVDDTSRDLQSQLKEVNRQLKHDPSNTILLQQKQELLTKEVKNTSQKLAALKEAERQAQVQFAQGKISQEQYQALQREVIKTESQLKELEKAAAASNATLSKVSAVADQVAAGANKVASAMKALSTAAAGGVAGLAALAVKAGQSADDLNTLSKQSGFATDDIQKWQYASDLVDVSVDDIVSSAQKMKRNMVSTSTETQEAWQRIGVSVTDANGNLRDSTTVFYEALQGLSQVENGTERDTLAMQLFGKSADQLAGIVDDGGAALQGLGQQAQDAGLILSQDALNGANAFKDGIDTLKAKTKSAFLSAGNSLAQNLLPMLDNLVQKISGILQWVAQLNGTQLKTLGVVLLVVAAISPVAKLIGGISSAVSGLSKALAFLAANPVVLIIAAVAALVAGLIYLWNTNENFRTAITNIWNSIAEFFQGIPDWWSNLWTQVGQFFTNTWNSILAFFSGIPGKIWTFLTDVVTKVTKWAGNLITTATTEIPKFVTTVVTFIGELPVKMLEIGVNIVKGIWSGITSAVDWLHEMISDFCTGIVNSFKSILGIHSPSTLFADMIGKNLALGIGEGFTGNMKAVVKTMANALPTTWDTGVQVRTAMATAYGGGQQQSEAGALVKGVVNGIAAVMNSASQRDGRPIKIDLKVDSKTASSVLYDPLKNIAKQKGDS